MWSAVSSYRAHQQHLVLIFQNIPATTAEPVKQQQQQQRAKKKKAKQTSKKKAAKAITNQKEQIEKTHTASQTFFP